MTDLYIANCTKQHHIFRYRKPEQGSASMISIPAGTQIKIADLSGVDVDAIISPHRTYGMTDISSVDRMQDFSGYCYSVDKQIPGRKLTYAVESRMSALAKAGEEMRKVSALANARTIDEKTIASDVRVNAAEVEIEEESDDPNHLRESIKFVQEGGDNSPPAPKKRRGRPRKNA